MGAQANLYDAIHASADPSRVALRFPCDAPLTYDALHRACGRYTAALATLGVRPSDRVSFRLEKSLEVIFLAHACLRLGAVLHPINPAYTEDELVFFLSDAAPRLLVCHEAESKRLRRLVQTTGALLETLETDDGGTLGRRACATSEHPHIHCCDAVDAAAILYTSGTTGRPKGAIITHGNLTASARALGKVWALGPDDVLLHALPLYHAHGLLTALNSMLVAGGAVLLMPRFEAREVIAQLPRATVMMGVPTFYARLLKQSDLETAIAPSLRLFISGSAPLPAEVADAFAARTDRRILERYGSTEAAVITALPAGTSGRAGWVGWPLPGIELCLRTKDGSRLDRGVGTLLTRGHNVFKGYWRNPAADRESFTDDGWFITGDIAEIDETGCVRIIDREKDLVISGGLNVYPKEIEMVLESMPGIQAAAAFGARHSDFGEAVIAVVEPTQPGTALDEAAVIAVLRQRLAAYKIPKRVLTVEALPRNHLGKILKTVLRERYREILSG